LGQGGAGKQEDREKLHAITLSNLRVREKNAAASVMTECLRIPGNIGKLLYKKEAALHSMGSHSYARMNFPRIRLGRPQQIAGLLLLSLLGECLWIVSHQTLTEQDYKFARCGREMWERPSPLAGYFTTCGNVQDGTLAYRVAGLPLTLDRIVSQLVDKFRKPENRMYTGESSDTSTWEMRHELRSVVLLEHLPFVLFAIWLGGGLWWVARRLFGNEGGFLALAFYCVCPAVLHAATTPNNDILAAWGLYGTVYTAIGVAHAMQGPRRKWRPRIVLLTIALGLTASASITAGIFGLLASIVLMLYLAEERRTEVMQVLAIAIAGALAIVFASYAFSAGSFGYLLRGGGARIWFSLLPAQLALLNFSNASLLIALGVAVLLYPSSRRCRYFGNTVPLLLALLLLPLVTTQVVTRPWLWALPFLFTFMGGVWADALETRWRKAFLVLGAAALMTQALLAWIVIRAAAI
jgi:hypothetical protein